MKPASAADESGPPIRVLISYVTDGVGHRRAAQALEEAARRRLPGAEIHCVDLLSYCPGWLRRGYPGLYRLLVRWLPGCWAMGYYGLDARAAFALAQLGRRSWNLAVSRRFQDWVRELRPDVAVATHFFPADVLDAGKRAGWLTGRLVVAITDLFPHRFWLVPGADAYVVGSEETKRRCKRRGIPGERVHALGIPISGVFARLPERAEARRTLGLDPGRLTVLMASGGMGFGPMRALARRLAASELARSGRLQVLVVCGSNEALAAQLRRQVSELPLPVRVFGFVANMHELIAASDLFVTKPGGLTIMESLAAGVPMVLSGTIPGQERFNAEYVLASGAAENGATCGRVIERVTGLLHDRQRLEAMAHRARGLGRPHAADELVERLIVPLGGASKI